MAAVYFNVFSLLSTTAPVSFSLSLSLLLLVFLAAWLKGEVNLQDSDGSLQSSSDPVDMSYLADKQSGGIS